jgi:hypothetical protein
VTSNAIITLLLLDACTVHTFALLYPAFSVASAIHDLKEPKKHSVKSINRCISRHRRFFRPVKLSPNGMDLCDAAELLMLLSAPKRLERKSLMGLV